LLMKTMVSAVTRIFSWMGDWWCWDLCLAKKVQISSGVKFSG